MHEMHINTQQRPTKHSITIASNRMFYLLCLGELKESSLQKEGGGRGEREGQKHFCISVRMPFNAVFTVQSGTMCKSHSCSRRQQPQNNYRVKKEVLSGTEG
ncbi:hypothetical protein XENOCAPTIV_013773 [Xenoophorus captivus]|uniref:Uncharacterized protein n=1 Tax=Xenoophorus captivus TaxID=1517983 RepID=A0ABV0QLY7_9TELE